MKKLTAECIKNANSEILAKGSKREIFVELFGEGAAQDFNSEHSFRVFIEKLSQQLSIAHSITSDFQKRDALCQLVADAVNE